MKTNLQAVMTALVVAATAVHAATFPVTNAADSGAGTLRAAITNANQAGAGAHFITFNLAAPYTITPATTLPDVTNHHVLVDGATQPGYTGAPLVKLVGTLAPDAQALAFYGIGGGAQGLHLTGFTNAAGVLLQGVSNRVTACWAFSNYYGVLTGAFSSKGSIGGLAATNRNVLSGNVVGLQLSGSGGDLVQGNYIGTTPDGLGALGNRQTGLSCHAPRCTIGGTTAGARNIIAGSASVGLNLAPSTATTVSGNFIGTDRTGTNALANGGAGVLLSLSTSNTIGGATPAHANIISGNGDSGIIILHNSSRNLIESNVIGLGTNGLALPNGTDPLDAGLEIRGVSNAVAFNTISGNNVSGILLTGTNAVGNSIYGNTIGLNPAATQIRRNLGHGIYMVGGASRNFIHDAPFRNVISGNDYAGVGFDGAGGSNTIQGNFIGTDISGTLALSNALGGIIVNGATGTTITANLISGNRLVGVHITGAGSRDTRLNGNFIGVNVSLTNPLPNSGQGIRIDGGSGHSVGGGGRNVISGNSGVGVWLTGTLTNVLVANNYIGVGSNGTTRVANSFGIYMDSVAGAHIALSNNVISGNNGHGIYILAGTATNRTIGGNIIGMSGVGASVVSNNGDGLRLESVHHLRIGGSLAADRNVISGNAQNGIQMSMCGSNGPIVIAGNYIGLDRFGFDGPGNNGAGIRASLSPNVQVGGPTAAWRNYIGRNIHGIINEQSGANWWIAHNSIGIDLSGFVARGNTGSGIQIHTMGRSNIVENNYISGNGGVGVVMETDTRGSVLRANRIGVGEDHVFALPNGNHGVELNDTWGVTVGGLSTNDANIIAYNHAPGIAVLGATPGARSGNRLLGNLIYSNFSGGIDLGADGDTPNDAAPDADAGPNELQNFPNLLYAAHGGTNLGGRMIGSHTTYRLEFFALKPAGGMMFIGAGDHYNPPTGTGSFSFAFNTAVPAGSLIVATATGSDGTSEFSAPTPMFDLDDSDGDGMPDWWEIANDLNEGVPNGPTDDADGDGVPDLEEWVADTQADDPNSYLAIVALDAGLASRTAYVPSSGTRRYTLEAASAPGAAWQVVQDNVQGTGALLALGDVAPLSQRCYRVKAKRP